MIEREGARVNQSSTDSSCICPSSLLYLPAYLAAYTAVALCIILYTPFTLYYCFLFSVRFGSFVHLFARTFVHSVCMNASERALFWMLYTERARASARERASRQVYNIDDVEGRACVAPATCLMT